MPVTLWLPSVLQKSCFPNNKTKKGLSHLVKPKKSENDNKKAQETAKTVNETVK